MSDTENQKQRIVTQEQKKNHAEARKKKIRENRQKEQKERKTARVIDLTDKKLQKIQNRVIAKVTGQLKRTAPIQNLEKYDIPQDDIRATLRNSLYWYGRKLVKDEQQCAERLNEFFTRVVQTGQIPTVQRMCLALGADTRLVWKWQANGDQRGVLTKQAKQILADMDAELASKGKIPQVVYIFRSKNFYSLSDRQQIAVVSHQQEMQTKQSIIDKYGKDEFIQY